MIAYGRASKREWPGPRNIMKWSVPIRKELSCQHLLEFRSDGQLLKFEAGAAMILKRNLGTPRNALGKLLAVALHNNRQHLCMN